MTSLEKKPCVFFDRDGVVNVSPGAGYVLRPRDFLLQDGIAECVKLANDRGYVCVLMTSQRCVSKGLISEEELMVIHEKMCREIREQTGGEFLDLYIFTGLPGTETWEKPSPVMIELAAEKHGLDLSKSWMIGDADRDIVMAHRAGVAKTIRVLGDKEVTSESDYQAKSIRQALTVLKENL